MSSPRLRRPARSPQSTSPLSEHSPAARIKEATTHQNEHSARVRRVLFLPLCPCVCSFVPALLVGRYGHPKPGHRAPSLTPIEDKMAARQLRFFNHNLQNQRQPSLSFLSFSIPRQAFAKQRPMSSPQLCRLFRALASVASPAVRGASVGSHTFAVVTLHASSGTADPHGRNRDCGRVRRRRQLRKRLRLLDPEVGKVRQRALIGRYIVADVGLEL